MPRHAGSRLDRQDQFGGARALPGEQRIEIRRRAVGDAGKGWNPTGSVASLQEGGVHGVHVGRYASSILFCKAG